MQIILLKSQTLVLQLQLKEEMEVETWPLSLVLWTIWHQKSIWFNLTKENTLMYLPQQSFCSLWLHNIHPSQQHNHLTHSTDALLAKEEISSGELTAKINKEVKSSFQRNLRTSLKQCLSLNLVRDQQLLKLKSMLGCKDQFQPRIRLLPNLKKETQL